MAQKKKKWMINPKVIQWNKKKEEEEAWSYINIEHITYKSDGSLLQGVITEQDK